MPDTERPKNDSQKKWEVLRSKTVFDNPWYRLRQDEVKLPNGTVIPDFFISELKDVALVCPITEDGNIVFVKQYRHGPRKTLLELPAGTYERGKQNPLEVARRELRAETGYIGNRWVLLGTLYDYPTKDSHCLKIYLAENAQLVGQPTPSPSEEIEVILIPLLETPRLIQKGKIRVTGTISAITLATRYLENRGKK